MITAVDWMKHDAGALHATVTKRGGLPRARVCCFGTGRVARKRATQLGLEGASIPFGAGANRREQAAWINLDNLDNLRLGPSDQGIDRR